MTTDAQLRRAFHKRMIDLYKEEKEVGYNATRFLQMLCEPGRDGLDVAKQLLESRELHEGFAQLRLRDRLDLSVEAVIVEESGWWPLLSDDEIRTARQRLEDVGYL
jgi:hypothetical protein